MRLWDRWVRRGYRVEYSVSCPTVSVERGHSAPVGDAVFVRELPVLHVDLLERLDVLGHEGHRHHDQVHLRRRRRVAEEGWIWWKRGH